MTTFIPNEPMLPLVPAADHAKFVDTMHDIYVGSDNESQDIDGLELSDAARVLCVSIDELWCRIRNGSLLARTMRGKVFVYTDLHSDRSGDLHNIQESMSLPLPSPSPLDTGLSANDVGGNIDGGRIDVPSHIALSTSELLNITGIPRNQELSLLIDHLSLAKEENREILRLTQDSMARLTQMTDSILEMKDSIIAAKEEQLAIMKERLAEQAAELSHALKEKENLETLARAIQI